MVTGSFLFAAPFMTHKFFFCPTLKKDLIFNYLPVVLDNNMVDLGVAAWLSGLASLSIALGVRGSNPGVDTGEKGKKEEITFHIFWNCIVYP
jgi:hypothetical protein